MPKFRKSKKSLLSPGGVAHKIHTGIPHQILSRKSTFKLKSESGSSLLLFGFGE
jgi:hypothetical protein